MNSTRTTTGILLIAVPLIFAAGFSGLQASFGYPDILRHPAADVLTRFAAAGVDVHLYWYAMFAAALGLIPASLGLGVLSFRTSGMLAAAVAGFGLLAGLVQALGLLGWVMLVPGLSATYVATGASDLDRALAIAMFDAANHYLGMGVGEHLGYFFTGLWTAGVAILIWSSWRPLAVVGLGLASGIVVGMLEPFGVAGAGTINAISFSGWPLWALTLGIMLLRRAPAALPQMA